MRSYLYYNCTSVMQKVLPVTMSDAERLRVLSESSGIDTLINARAADADIMNDEYNLNRDGTINVRVWQRDCDCAEWAYVATCQPTLLALLRFTNDILEGAEGPVSVSLLTAEDAAEFQPESRDRVLEAFENGNTYLV